MELSEKEGQTFDCDGTSVTVFFSSDGKLLQDCIVDVLNIHLDGQGQT